MSARIGIMARTDDRGIGVQTWEVARHLPEASVLAVRHPVSERQGFPSHHAERFPDARVVRWNNSHHLPEAPVREWLAELDVVYSVESLMDERVQLWARDAGVATVVHANPELYRPQIRPDVVWLPTPWMLERFAGAPSGALWVPVPLPEVPAHVAPAPIDAPLSVCHVMGRRAAHDRNGTSTLMRSLQFVERQVDVTIYGQEPSMPARVRNKQVTWRYVANTPNRWDMYDGHHLLVMPRKYGGLCLPVQEAMGVGLGVMMPNCSPNQSYTTTLLRTIPPSAGDGRTVQMPGGEFTLHDVDPRDLARAIDEYSLNMALRATAERHSAAWADGHRWANYVSVYRHHLEEAANR